MIYNAHLNYYQNEQWNLIIYIYMIFIIKYRNSFVIEFIS